jgi:hypothetical protein
MERAQEQVDALPDGDWHLATVTVPAGDVEDILISEGLSLPYVAGERDERTKHWCGE